MRRTVRCDLFGKIMSIAPAAANGTADLGQSDAGRMVPKANEGRSRFYGYEGSLTTPPCAETVTRTVLGKSIKVSTQAIDAFGHLFDMNARLPQPQNRCHVLEGGRAAPCPAAACHQFRDAQTLTVPR